MKCGEVGRWHRCSSGAADTVERAGRPRRLHRRRFRHSRLDRQLRSPCTVPKHIEQNQGKAGPP